MTNTDTDQVEAPDPVIHVQMDYFGLADDHRFLLPDGHSYVMLKEMREGERRRYLNKTNRDITIAKHTGDAKLRLAPGDERYELLMVSITGWNLVRDGKEVHFTQKALGQFLDVVDPNVANLIEEEVRKLNPWLNSELSIEDIEEEIERLEKLLSDRKEEEEGKRSS